MQLTDDNGESIQLIGESSLFIEELLKIPAMARCSCSVVICGEPGTGKKSFARRIHRLSDRVHRPFVAISCEKFLASQPERIRFDHLRGACAEIGDSISIAGLIEQAEGGTLLLDKVASLPESAQMELLRFLREKSCCPTRSSGPSSVDVRTIATLSMDPEEAVASGQLRRSLWESLSVICLRIPPLRERGEDIPLLARYFVKKHGSREGSQVEGISLSAMHKLLDYDWPGNVRELEHAIELAMMVCEGRFILPEDIPLPVNRNNRAHELFHRASERFTEEFERAYIQKLLLLHRGNVTQAAGAAQQSRRIFWKMIRRHRIEVRKYG